MPLGAPDALAVLGKQTGVFVALGFFIFYSELVCVCVWGGDGLIPLSVEFKSLEARAEGGEGKGQKRERETASTLGQE